MEKSHSERQPIRLRRGKAYHRAVQAEWKKVADGQVSLESLEKAVAKGSGAPGRVDVLVISGGNLAAVAEIKASDWDHMTGQAVRRNAHRQIRQVWDYIRIPACGGTRRVARH
jgi:hypothetical protein